MQTQMQLSSAVNRRSFFALFGKFTLAIAAASTMIADTACFLSSVYTNIKNYGPTVLAAVATVVSILTTGGALTVPLSAAISGVLALISTAIANLIAAVNNYDNAPSASKSTALGAVATALADAEANVQQFWNDLSIPDAALATLVQNLLGVVVSTLQGYINALPAQANSATPAMVKRSSLQHIISVPAKRRSIGQFKSDFNSYLKSTAYADRAL